MKLRKGDTVTILKGSDRKKSGEILRVVRSAGKVVVSGVNIRTIHKKPRTRDEKGSIIKVEYPIDASNVALIDPKTKQSTRLGYIGVGKNKQRVSKKTGNPIADKVTGKKISLKKDQKQTKKKTT